MTDAIAVFPPGFRLTDASGAPVSGGSVNFYDAGTTTPRTVYSNSGLSSSLGTVVYTNSDGVPVASYGSNTAVMVYTGASPYKIIFKDGDGTTLFGGAFDNIKGALDTSTFLTTGSTSTLTQPVITKTANYTVVAADRSKLIECNTTGGQFTLTLTAAATLGDNWSVKIRNSGTANQFILSASQNIAFEGQTFTARAFQPGEGCEIICDGTGFKIVGHQPPLMASRGPAIITITDRVTSDPSATAGARYIVQTGYGSYATHDIIEANGSSFNKYTPPTDCGWLAYVQDENTLYQFQDSAWVCLTATTAQAIAGTDNAAFMTALAVRNAFPARAYNEYTANSDLSTTIPNDDTIPQNTEGTQILTVSITPKTTSSRIRIRFQGTYSLATGNSLATAALFKDSGADAIAAVGQMNSLSGATDGQDKPQPIALEFEHAPSTTSAITYAIRVGASSGNMRMNGTSAARKLGGVMRSTLIAEELIT